MALSAKSRLTPYGGTRHTIYVPLGLVRDSAFPFEAGQRLHLEIRGSSLIVTAASKRKET